MSGSVRVFKVSEQCDCKKGYRSRIDGKCQNCRNHQDVLRFNTFWREVGEKDIREGTWEWKYLCRKHYGGIYEIN